MRAAFIGPGVCGLGFGVAMLTNLRGDHANAPAPVTPAATGQRAETSKLILSQPREVR
jgi:hypothetical protein